VSHSAAVLSASSEELDFVGPKFGDEESVYTPTLLSFVSIDNKFCGAGMNHQLGFCVESDRLRALRSFACSSQATSAFVSAKRRIPASRIAESGTLLKGV
jgi:hypothetical protein